MIQGVTGKSAVIVDRGAHVTMSLKSPALSSPIPVIPRPQSIPSNNATSSLADLMPERRSREEIETTARRSRLTLDLFEIKGEIEVDEKSNRIKVTVRNTRTGQILQRIPVFELRGVYAAFRDNLGLSGPMLI